MPLDIIVVGAGIGGLTAAIALAQGGGHHVTILEKSKFATEIGAALALAPNGARVLDALGFSFDRARAVPLTWWDTVNGATLERLSTIDLTDSARRFGQPTWTVHRVDFHNELLRIAGIESADTQAEGGRVLKQKAATKGRGTVELRLGSPVASVIDAATGVLKLEDGTELRADLIVGADGVKSVIRNAVIGGGEAQASSETPSDTGGEEEQVMGRLRTGMSAFRFLIPTEVVRADERLAELLSWKKLGSSLFTDQSDPESQRHAVWYSCRGGEVQNLVGLHPTRQNSNYETEDLKSLLLDEFKHYHPDLVTLFSHAENVSCWPLYDYEPIPSWSKGRTVLIGDAAHPIVTSDPFSHFSHRSRKDQELTTDKMLPFGGQAANQALEDAGALGYLFSGVDKPDPEKIAERLALFDQVRRKRGSMIQVLSSFLVGREGKAKEKMEPFVEDGYLDLIWRD